MASLTFVLRASDLNGRLRADLLAEGGAVRRDVQRRARNVRDEARHLAAERSRESSGALPRSIRYVTREAGGGRVAAQVGSDLPHALWTEEGTGVYGPRRTRIFPRTAPLLVFESRSGAVIRALSVAGQPGKHYLRDALKAATP